MMMVVVVRVVVVMSGGVLNGDGAGGSGGCARWRWSGSKVMMARGGEWCMGSSRSEWGSIFGFAGNARWKSFQAAAAGDGG
nr:hypothetical protein [Tanacetum cinerariifolium]